MITIFKAVTLSTNQLNELKSFYQNILEMPLIKDGADSFTLRIGSSTLTFKASRLPAYHFAFNIPGTHIGKTEKMVTTGGGIMNGEDGNDEIYYKSFNTWHYLDDPAGNVVEFIGRRTKVGVGNFTPDSLLNISEMSITTPDVPEVAMKLNEFGVTSRNDNAIEPDSLELPR